MPVSFVQDKRAFFQNPIVVDDMRLVRERFNGGDIQEKFKFLSDNRGTIEHEFNELHACLKRKGGDDRYWSFCYYTSFMLQTYYETYAPEKASKYKEACEALERRFMESSEQEQPSFVKMLNNDLNDVLSTPTSVAKLRKLVGELNMQRLSTRFSLLTLKQFLLLAEQWQMLSASINLAILDAPLGVYNALSVALCGIRLLLDLGTLVKHTYFPVDGEDELSKSERAWVEIQAHYYHLLNDSIWSTVNALCNYGSYFHVAAPVATLLMVGFTVFDIVWLGVVLNRIDADYEYQRKERKAYIRTLDLGSPERLMEDDLLIQLELHAERDRCEFVFYLVAACLLECGFLAAFILAPPALMPMCLLMCNAAIAMYLSGDKYGVYREKCLGLAGQVDPETGQHVEYNTATQQEVDKAWADVQGTWIKNAVMPFILLGTFTLNVPAAIALTLAYIAHERGLTERYAPKVMEYFSNEKLTPSMG